MENQMEIDMETAIEGLEFRVVSHCGCALTT